jgi:hypothetical protein
MDDAEYQKTRFELSVVGGILRGLDLEGFLRRIGEIEAGGEDVEDLGVGPVWGELRLLRGMAEACREAQRVEGVREENSRIWKEELC